MRGRTLALNIRILRGLGEKLSISPERKTFRALWRDLFFDFDETSTIELRSIGSGEHTRSLTVSYGAPKGTTLPFGKRSVEASVREATLDFRYRTASGEALQRQPTLTPEGLSFGAPVETFPAILLTPMFREDPGQNGQRFSALSVKGEQETVVSVLRKHFPFIEDLSVEYYGGAAMVHAKLRSMSEKVPLPLVSDGINKMLSILLAVHNFSRGVVLIDEMENGLYFDLMGRASAAILDATREANTQLFATTHSLEYLRALLPVVQEYPDDFRLLRTTKDNGASAVDCFDGRHFVAALEEGLEIR